MPSKKFRRGREAAIRFLMEKDDLDRVNAEIKYDHANKASKVGWVERGIAAGLTPKIETSGPPKKIDQKMV